MSKNYDVVTPSSIEDQETDDKYDSPAERVRDAFGERLDREWAIADDNHPLVKTAGTAEALRSSVPERVQQLLADDLYQDPDVFWREWLQNHEAACIREAKRIVKAEHGEDALYTEVEHTHESLDEPRIVRLPKQAEDIMPMARDLGYDPVIEFEVDIETRTITTRDNGIGMTTAEAIEVWNEPVESTSGTDLSSAGNKGIGALTWNSIAEDDAGIFIRTKTRRERTLHTDEPVPPHDREGYNFFSYLGGIIPVPGDVDDAFYGTEFQIPVAESYDLTNTKSALMKYLDLSPVKVRWVQKQGGQTLGDEEWEPTTFFGRYDHPSRDAPLISIHRPGEFSLALDKPDIVQKSYNTTDTFLLDMPIERNGRRAQKLDTLFNDHLHLHNEQGLIVDGPNRGRLKQQVDELHDDDVPMPTPTADRDRLARGDDLSKFLNHVNEVAMAEEKSIASDLIEQFFDQPDIESATKFISGNVEEFELALKFLDKHYGTRTTKPKKILRTLVQNDEFGVDETGIYKRAVKQTSRSRRGKRPRGGSTSPPETVYEEHPLRPLVELFVDLQETVSYATNGNSNPNKKSNRGSKELYHLLNDLDQKMYVAKQVSADRAKVAWNTYPDALVIKVDSYGKWLQEPFNATKLKDVPFKESNNEDGEFDIPDAINEAHTYTKVRSVDGDGDMADDPIRLRANADSTAVDARPTLDELTDALDATDFGDHIRSGEFHVPHLDPESRKVDAKPHRYIVVFPSSTRAENISEHYGWQKDAMLARGTVAQCERLLEYPQVFKPEQFKSFIADQTIPVEDLFEGTHERVKLRNLDDTDKDLMVMKSGFNQHLRMLYGSWSPAWPDGSDERKQLAVERFFEAEGVRGYKNPATARYTCPGCGDGFDSKRGRSMHINYCDDATVDEAAESDADEWRFAMLGMKQMRHLTTYLRLCTDEDHPLRKRNQIHIVGAKYAPPQVVLYKSKPYRGSYQDISNPTSKELEKAMWEDVWPRDSNVWNRFNRNRYLKKSGKEVYRLLRSKGINPEDFERSGVHDRALGHILEREVDYDA